MYTHAQTREARTVITARPFAQCKLMCTMSNTTCVCLYSVKLPSLHIKMSNVLLISPLVHLFE